ncbi:enoyl-CoA hydratase 2, peroxisomal [Curcuma longa]|uniref:enoyl-CoA hydratase 2, peroxisomal n=1 Tax=Curcuma longa TaxID=136217 RepID=UPI003D9E9868
MVISNPSSSAIDPELVISHRFSETSFCYTERDVALYALGIGTCSGDAVDEKELIYVYHKNGQKFIKVFPTFAALFPFARGLGLEGIHGLQYDPRLLLHGQQYIEIYRPLPSNSCILNKVKVAGLHDKGKATIIEIETTSYIKESGEVLCMNRSSIYLRGSGGFSSASQPYSYKTYSDSQPSRFSIPKHQPTAIFEETTQLSQALLYRLSGDYNPLHSDPMIAQVAGFARPILHGLCTLGFAVRAIIRSFCDGEATAVKNIFGRFLLHVYPGETLVTEMWLEGSRAIYQTKVKERNRVVLSGYVLLKQNSSL